MDGEDWNLDEEDTASSPCSHRVVSKLQNDGYRIGKAQGDELEMQRGFDVGFSEGMVLGKLCGRLYGHFCNALMLKKEMGELKKGETETTTVELKCKIERIIFQVIPEFTELTAENTVDELREIAAELSPNMAAIFATFELEIGQVLEKKG